MMTGSLSRNQFRDSSKSGRWSRFGGGRYAPISGVFRLPSTILQLTTFGLQKRIELTIHPSRFSRDKITTPPPVLPRLQ